MEMKAKTLFALTLTGSTQLDDNLKLITELRYDNSDDYIIEGIAAEKKRNSSYDCCCLLFLETNINQSNI